MEKPDINNKLFEDVFFGYHIKSSLRSYYLLEKEFGIYGPLEQVHTIMNLVTVIETDPQRKFLFKVSLATYVGAHT